MRLVPIDHPALVMACHAVETGGLSYAAMIADNLLRVMHEHRGVGLAANQIGCPIRLFVVDVRAMRLAKLAIREEVYINPVLRFHDQTRTTKTEGCLSEPEKFYDIERYAFAEIEAMRLDGSVFTLRSGGLAARCWQHEVDHLDGIRLCDRARMGSCVAGGAA